MPSKCSPVGENGGGSRQVDGTHGLAFAPLAAVSEGEDRTRVSLLVLAQGRDLVLTVSGGEAHVGAVAVCSPASGTQGEPHAATSVVPGHKEGPLAEEGAARLAAAMGCTCVAVVGIHVDNALPEEIATIVANTRRGFERLSHDLRKGQA